MPRAKRICPKPGCPRVVNKRYCTDHEREYERERGSREQRGYDHSHRKLRQRLNDRITSGLVACARCGERIHPGTEWALDHDDIDRTKYLGPSHKHCNDSAGGKASHR